MDWRHARTDCATNFTKDETNGKGEPLVHIQNAIDQAGCFPSRNALVLMVRS
jgi:hypothetical protein